MAGGKRPEVHPVQDLEKDMVGWEGDDDPANPRNYPVSRKWFLMLLVSTITFISPFASSVFSPGVVYAEEEFGVTSSILGTLSVTGYLIGYVTGPLIFSPMSEMLGRRIVLSGANTFFVAFQVGCALAPNISALIVFRFLTGIGGSACLTTGGGVVADLFVAEQRGIAMAVYTTGILIGPVLGPLLGGFIAQRAGWHWVFWVLVIAGGTLSALVMIFNRETNPVVLMRWKTERLRKELNRPELYSCYEPNGGDSKASFRSSLGKRLIMPFYLLVRSPIVFPVATYLATLYGCLYLLFTTISDVFKKTYGWDTEISGLAYLGLGVGFISGQIFFALVSDRIITRLKVRNNNVFEPEMRLSITIFFAFFIPVSFFWYGWSAKAKDFWIVPIIGLAPFAFGMVGIYNTLQTYVIDCYPRYAASGTAAMVITRSLMGAFLPLAGPRMYAALGYGWGNSLLGFVTLAMIPVPVLFYKYGGQVRKASELNL
ncbi:MFS multidrug transporter [Aspergillus sclerotioniger CBS 115572]|uniref:MFS multidrug transporter n=1 Tax=Aspergillus sclerotioniger CBS 115572 TaxID=1450535 RepID=A0A317VMT0_9EURO|nr:MFS multidrug transporter [Aspergillus sclerotioniger CBS 115572]PWY75225.1 MFS multidrug transporter [Aspergillus sclerotioniger CBS 115572]